MKENKFYFENMFATKWTNTPIHFVGEEFDSKGITSWINPRFVPSGGTLAALSGQLTRIKSELDVVCWGKNEMEAFDLADSIIEFVKSNADEFSITHFEINDHGWNESNMVYIIVTFALNYYEGDCTAPQPAPITRTVTHMGATVVNHGTILTN